MKLALKLLLAFAGVIALLITAATFGGWQLLRSLDTYEHAVEAAHAQEREVLEISGLFKTQVQEWKNTLLRGRDEAARLKYWQAFQQVEQQVAQRSARLVQTLPPGAAHDEVKRFQAAHESMARGYRKGYEAYEAAAHESGAGDAAVKGIDREPTQRLLAAVKIMASQREALAATAAARAEQALRTGVLEMILVTAAAVAGAVSLSRRIVRPVDSTIAALQQVAQGDLTQAIAQQGDEEIATMLRSLQQMQVQLAGVVDEVRHRAEGVASASTQIAQGNQDLSDRTERQASALEQSAAAMHELGSAVASNTASTHQASELARQASEVARTGGSAVGQVVQTMNEINEASRRIADIVGVIDGIAFQTNILALNAAVEAARAGEQGRGFAVVAGEVRLLAQRSANAAREIKALIAASVERVERGCTQVDQAGSTMDEVVRSIRHVTEIVSEITLAHQEQGNTIAQVAQAVAEMDQFTQQNSALVEESAAAAASLRDQAQQLLASVQRFRTAPA